MRLVGRFARELVSKRKEKIFAIASGNYITGRLKGWPVGSSKGSPFDSLNNILVYMMLRDSEFWSIGQSANHPTDYERKKILR